MNIYVASSWRNEQQPAVVAGLRAEGYEVYDFRNPVEGDHGFQWSDIDPEWESWAPLRFRAALQHRIAVEGRHRDMEALKAADAVVLVMPCGRSAHLELGYAVGAGKPTAILLSSGEPELMYGIVDNLCESFEGLRIWLASLT